MRGQRVAVPTGRADEPSAHWPRAAVITGRADPPAAKRTRRPARGAPAWRCPRRRRRRRSRQCLLWTLLIIELEVSVLCDSRRTSVARLHGDAQVVAVVAEDARLVQVQQRRRPVHPVLYIYIYIYNTYNTVLYI